MSSDVPEPVLPAMMRRGWPPVSLLGALSTSMSCARVLGAAQVCPAPLTCLVVPALALFCAQKPKALKSL